MNEDAVTTVVLARAQWPDGDVGTELPAVAGFIESAFSPIVAAVAERCLGSFFGPPPVGLARGERIAIALATATGDLTTAAAVAAAVQAGRRVPPLLFYQSNPNAVAGYIAARWGLAGPVVCTVPARTADHGTADHCTADHCTADHGAAARVLAEAMATAGVLIDDGDADAALVIAANAYLGGAAWGIAELIGPPWWSPGAASGPAGTARSVGNHPHSRGASQ